MRREERTAGKGRQDRHNGQCVKVLIDAHCSPAVEHVIERQCGVSGPSASDGRENDHTIDVQLSSFWCIVHRVILSTYVTQNENYMCGEEISP